MKLHGGGSAQQEEGATEVHTGQLLWTTGVRLSTLQQPSVVLGPPKRAAHSVLQPQSGEWGVEDKGIP